MKTFTQTLTLDTQFAHLYRPLVRNLVLIISATVILAAGVLLYFDHRLVNSLSERLIEKNTMATEQQLYRLFNTAAGGLSIAHRQIGSLTIGDAGSQDRLLATLSPFLSEFEFLDSINLADSAGNEFVLIKKPGEILTRNIDASEPHTAIWRRYQDGNVIEEWQRQTDISPLQRPWYQGAVALEAGEQFWTSAYAFLTTREPGLSVSTRRNRPDGHTDYVVAFNIALTDISRHTTHLRPSDHGMTVVFNNEDKTIGLPPDARFEDEQEMLSAVLSPVDELGIPALSAALAAWEANGRSQGIFHYADETQTTWWAGFSTIPLSNEVGIWSAVLIPEADFMGSVTRLRNLSLAGIGIGGLILAAAVFAASMRSIRRQVQAAVDRVEQRLGQYRLKQKIGEGGNGAVYRAQHALLRRPTAIKLMSPEFARSQAARDRFEHEVQITSSLSHPNTIAIYDYGQTPDDTLYYAMELLDGITLDQLVRLSGPVPASRVISILEQMAGSLAEAHDKGLIHRDIKPSNAILCERGGLFDVVKVLDFGLVKEIAQTDGNLTHADVLIGTPLYMAPEVISQPGKASPQSDIYAIGAVGYFLLAARNVFEGGSAVEICAKHLNDRPIPPPQRSGLATPEDLEALILMCLEKDPAQRPEGAANLRERLLACADAGKWTQREARGYWQSHSANLTAEASPETAAQLSNTELLVDLDSRLLSTGVAQPYQ